MPPGWTDHRREIVNVSERSLRALNHENAELRGAMYPEQECKQLSLIERLREGWLPPAAIAGAFSAFVAAVFRSRPAAKGDPRPAVDSGLTNISFSRPEPANVSLPRCI